MKHENIFDSASRAGEICTFAERVASLSGRLELFLFTTAEWGRPEANGSDPVLRADRSMSLPDLLAI